MGRNSFHFEWLVFIPALLLLTCGLVVLLSFSAEFFYQQVFTAIVGIAVFFILSRVEFSLYSYTDTILYIFCIVLLLFTFLGPNVRGATRWIEIGSFRIQPSELVKPLFILCFSSFFVRFPPTKIRNVCILVMLLSIPFFLVYKQPDLGNSLVFGGIWLALLMVSDISPWWLLGGSLLFLISTPLGFTFLRDYQRQRLLTFLNPFLDPQGSGYNAIQSMITIGSGQIWGRGFGRGTQSILRFLPEHHTDFIFAAYIEEFGFIGGILLLAVFFALFWRILLLASKRISHRMSFYYITGFFTQLFIQMVINIGMNIGIIPVTGITLPFVSYGGSSLLSSWMGLGILVAALQTNRQKNS